MQTCDAHNDCVVVFTGKCCPLCELETDIRALEQENNDLQDAIEGLENNLKEKE